MNTRLLKNLRNKALIGIFVLFALSQTACGPTYPKEMLDRAVIQLCKEEYDIDVKVKLAGSTIAVYIPIENFLGEGLAISKDAMEKINDVVLSISRVTMSTDAPIQFYIVIAQDPILPELEIVIIRYVQDIKKLHYSQISRGEFFNRAIIEMKMTPQAQKEKILKTIFEQLHVEQTEELVNEFLTGDVNTIGDIGYWNNEFFIKDIRIEEFLAVQIVNRIKQKFEKEKELLSRYKLNSIKGRFVRTMERCSFEFNMSVASSGKSTLFLNDNELNEIFEITLEKVAHVLDGYKFEDFDTIGITDDTSGGRLILEKEELKEFRKKKLKIGDLIWRK